MAKGDKDKGSGKPAMSFYDVKSKKKFETTAYDVREKGGRFFAVTKSPSGAYECWRVLGKDQAAELKKAA